MDCLQRCRQEAGTSQGILQVPKSETASISPLGLKVWLREPEDEEATLRGGLPRTETFGQRIKLPVSVPQGGRNECTAFTPPSPSAVGLLTTEHNQQLGGGKPAEGGRAGQLPRAQGGV